MREGNNGVFPVASELGSIADAYFRRYRNTKDPKDLERGSRNAGEAVTRSSYGDPLRPIHINTLFECFDLGKKRVGQFDDSMMTGLLEESLSQGTTRLVQRSISGRRLVWKYAQEGAWRLAHRAAAQTVSLLPLLLPKSLRGSDMQDRMLSLRGLANEAAAVSLQAQQAPYEAIRLLELGRGCIQTSLSSLRVNLSELEAEHPQLTAAYRKIQAQLDTSPSAQRDLPTPSTMPHANTDSRYDVSQEFERLLTEIRKAPRFACFLLAQLEAEMTSAAAASGPIVVINVSKYYCDALIIEGSRIRILRLPQLRYEAINTYVRKLRATSIDLEVLQQLWKAAVKPVLAVLGFNAEPLNGRPWPHICWIPTGPLTGFPIHAARLHLRDKANVLINRAISTYSSSIPSLVEGHQYQIRSPYKRPLTAAFFGVEKNLASIEREIRNLREIYNQMGLQVLQVEPGTPQARLTDVLNQTDIFHFAGYGKANHLDPLKSSVVIGGVDGLLTVDYLFSTILQHRKPFLAYLSACSTGKIDHKGLINEGIHLITSCQMVGFRNIISMLWESCNESCRRITTATYEWIREH